MKLTLSEVMKIMIYYYYSGYKKFKDYYLKHDRELQSAFPSLVSYTLFIELKAKAMMPMVLFLRLCGLESTGISFMTALSSICFNSAMKIFYERLRRKGKAAQVALTAVLHK